MIDNARIEAIRQMPVAKAKAAMKEYAAELGVTVKARTIDNMVSEMGAQLAERESFGREAVGFSMPQTRVKSAAVVPGIISPILGQSFSFYAKLTDINNVDTCRFQWQSRSNSGAAFANINGATSQRLFIEKCTNGAVGEYQCVVTESDGTQTTSNTGNVAAVITPPAEFNDINLHKATWIDFYSQSFAPVGWHTLYEMYDILGDDRYNSTAQAMQAEMGKRINTIPLQNLLANTTELVATDSKNGYKHILSSENTRDNKPTIIGRFITT